MFQYKYGGQPFLHGAMTDLLGHNKMKNNKLNNHKKNYSNVPKHKQMLHKIKTTIACNSFKWSVIQSASYPDFSIHEM